MFGGLTLLSEHVRRMHGANRDPAVEEDRADAQATVGALPFEPMPGRAMKEYVVMPEAVWNDPDALEQWLLRSIEFVGVLPPKEPRPKKPRPTA
jgi:TfoX/Sxy family transcriptional regulator of competence genes